MAMDTEIRLHEARGTSIIAAFSGKNQSIWL